MKLMNSIIPLNRPDDFAKVIEGKVKLQGKEVIVYRIGDDHVIHRVSTLTSQP